MRLLGMAAGAALMVAGAAVAEDEPPAIAAVHVQADITAIASPEAAEFWADLESDLETALARELVGALDPEGMTLLVAVDELSLAEAFEAGFIGEDARLTGRAQLMAPDGSAASGVYEISASARQAEMLLPEGVDVVTIERTSAEFYDAVVTAFARGVVESVRPQE